MNKKQFTSLAYALNRIKSQARGFDPTTRKIASPEGELLFGVFKQSVEDALNTRSALRDGPASYGMSVSEMASSIAYLAEEEIPALEALGIETQWALNQLRKASIISHRAG